MAKKANEVRGVLLRANKTFYYLETGNMTLSNHIDRIQKTLLARDLLRYSGTQEEQLEEKFTVTTLQDAEEKGYAIEVMYLNGHVKEHAKESPSVTPKKLSWKKK